MQEIELKFKVDNLDKIKEKLLSEGTIFSDLKVQKDIIFVQDLGKTSNEEGNLFIRLRNTNGKTELTLKKATKLIMQSEEVEFEVSNQDEAKRFINLLGLKECVIVNKKRITTKYNNFNICMDEVDRLGSFIEIEVLTEDKDNTAMYEKQILDIAKKLDIDVNNRINSFYDTMISELNEESQ